MPIGAASYSEPHPGISADWLILGPGWVLAPALVAAGSAAAAALALTARRRHAVRAAPAWPRPPRPPGSAFRSWWAPGSRSSPGAAGRRCRSGLPCSARWRRAGRARRLHLLGRGVRRRGQPGALRPDLAAGHVPRCRRPGFGPCQQGPSDGGRVDPDVTGVDDARVAGAQSGQVSVESFTYDVGGGQADSAVLTQRAHAVQAGRRSCSLPRPPARCTRPPARWSGWPAPRGRGR